MWLGYAGNLLIELGDKSGAFTRYTEADGLHVGNITTVYADERAVIVAGEQGIALRDGRRFHVLAGAEGFKGVTGITASGDGSLWLNGSKGIIRMSLDSLRRAVRSPSHPPDDRLFDGYDGLSGIALQQTISSTAASSADGLLWFATNQGVAVIDPPGIGHNAIAPEVIVRSLVADDIAHPATGPLALPSRTHHVEIDYTATSLTIPERVRFRFRLEGVDAEWLEAGSRREAFYTNLGPGHYRFRVIAANNDGVWNERGASLEFTIAPTFFQTGWFALLCAAAVTFVLCAGYLLRVRQLTERMRARLEERERIARELHDTLLQGFQGLILRMYALVRQLGKEEPVAQRMVQAIDQAEALLLEGRDSVQGLRAVVRRGDLAADLMAVSKELAADPAPSLHVTVAGRPRPLMPTVHEELQRIGREAILNAWRHGQARRIEVTLTFARDFFKLSVRDDGKGIDLPLAQSASVAGHWGLAGMRERAQRMGARLELHTSLPGGVEVTVVLGARAAYEPAGRSAWVRRLRALRRPRQSSTGA